MKTFCAVPWKQLATSPSGTVRLCCESQHGLNLSRRADGKMHRLPTDLHEAWNSDFFRSVRSAMLKGEWHPACEPCRRLEAAGQESGRLH